MQESAKDSALIAAFIGESQQYVIVCEGHPLCVIKLQSSFIFSFFMLLLFNLEYPIPAKNMFLFPSRLYFRS